MELFIDVLIFMNYCVLLERHMSSTGRKYIDSDDNDDNDEKLTLRTLTYQQILYLK